MLNERQIKILGLLGDKEVMLVNDLASLLGVSAVTIRQDLRYLEAEGFLRRVHGGAILEDADDLAKRLGFNYEKKLRIASKAATLVGEGETVLLESGSTNALLARELAKRKNITVITTNAFIARQFNKSPQPSVILLGGIFQHSSESVVGALAKASVDLVNFDKAFIGVDGYTDNAGFTLRDFFRAEISAYIIKKAAETIIITDSSKFGISSVAKVCGPGDISAIATDSNIDRIYSDEFINKGIKMIIA